MAPVTDRVLFKVVHNLSTEKAGINLVRHTNRETLYLVPRPASGHADVEVSCGHCGRTQRHRILDQEGTRALRRASAKKWGLIAAGVAAAEALLILTGAAGTFPGALLVFFGIVGLLVTTVMALAGPRDLHGTTRIDEDGNPWQPSATKEEQKRAMNERVPEGTSAFCMVMVEGAPEEEDRRNQPGRRPVDGPDSLPG
ncbi:hypothetical protein O4J56_18565 [Nocardiopsis sp. RSe5-2]|uniref:Phage holin family protein n=1 Tax=Nocardiopsis endophytica TaxID=3018445 RepID=A0ABT4U6T0_9ACTN|nr:hypothetical protein [Nocardiopsis endophytica]MDA2812654.1 hypothetical protein [Nocardiopsis endophytica]